MAGFDIPEPHGLVRGAGERSEAIGAKGHVPDSFRVAFEHTQASAGFDIPEPHGLVIGTGERSAIAKIISPPDFEVRLQEYRKKQAQETRERAERIRLRYEYTEVMKAAKLHEAVHKKEEAELARKRRVEERAGKPVREPTRFSVVPHLHHVTASSAVLVVGPPAGKRPTLRGDEARSAEQALSMLDSAKGKENSASLSRVVAHRELIQAKRRVVQIALHIIDAHHEGPTPTGCEGLLVEVNCEVALVQCFLRAWWAQAVAEAKMLTAAERCSLNVENLALDKRVTAVHCFIIDCVECALLECARSRWAEDQHASNSDAYIEEDEDLVVGEEVGCAVNEDPIDDTVS